MKKTDRRAKAFMLDIERGLHDLNKKNPINKKYRKYFERCLNDIDYVHGMTDTQLREIHIFCLSELSKWRVDAFRNYYYSNLPEPPEKKGDSKEAENQYAEEMKNYHNPIFQEIKGNSKEAGHQFANAFKVMASDPDFIQLLPSEYSTVEKLRVVIDEKLNLSDKWDGLKSYLVNNKYIEDVSGEAFHAVMEYKSPIGDRIKWIGIRRSAGWFFTHFEFRLSKFNKCFEPKKGDPFRPNDYYEYYSPDNDFIDFLEEYKRTIITE